MSISAGFAHAGLPDGMAVALLGGAALGQQGGPGSIFSGFSSNRSAPPNDPFAARGADAGPAPDANGVTRLPPTGGPQLQAPPADRYPADATRTRLRKAPQGHGPGRESSPQRRLVAVRPPGPGRDRRAASQRLVAQARQEQIRYAPNEDSPERVEAAIAKFVEVSRLDRSTEENRKTYARMLMEQSEALLQWGELEQADKLAALAVEQRVAYGPFDAKPDDLLKRIAALRQQNNPAGPRQIDNRDAGPNAVGPSLAGRQQAVELMRQIRGGLGRRTNRPGGIPLPAARCPADSGKCLCPRRGSAGTGLPATFTRRWPATSRAWFRPEASASRIAGVQSAVYDPSRDPTRNMQVAAQQAESIPVAAQSAGRPAGRRRCGAAVARLQPVPTGRKRP